MTWLSGNGAKIQANSSTNMKFSDMFWGNNMGFTAYRIHSRNAGKERRKIIFPFNSLKTSYHLKIAEKLFLVMYKSEMSLVPELEGLNAPLVSPRYSVCDDPMEFETVSLTSADDSDVQVIGNNLYSPKTKFLDGAWQRILVARRRINRPSFANRMGLPLLGSRTGEP